jgi:hypothetical protein
MAGKAVLTGINRYKHISHLRGCINDVQNIRRLLIEMFAFSDKDIHVLTDDEVTKERIVDEWEWLTGKAKPGDNLVFHFSGHGSYVEDLDGDEDDGADELLCLYDMDFNDPDTYLLDDDMRKLTEQVPAGAYLTVILDQCHAGTATRLLFSPDEASRSLTDRQAPLVDQQVSWLRAAGSGARSLSLDKLPEQTLVLARFVEPPPGVLRAVSANRIHSRIARDSVNGDDHMNHVLWAASRSNQTAADAYIDGVFQGAFTYYFCNAVRQLGADAEHRRLHDAVSKALKKAHFTQAPQLEPRAVQGPLLRWAGNGKASGAIAETLSDGSVVASGSSELLSVLREFRDVVPLLRDIRDKLQRSDSFTDTSRAVDRALVYVHGICHHDADYAEPWWKSLRPHLSLQLQTEFDRNRYAVLWSDLVNGARSAAFTEASPERQQQEEELAEQIKEVLRDRADRQEIEVTPHQEAHETPRALQVAEAERALFGIPGLNCVDDFVQYLLNNGTRAAIQKRFIDAVIPLLRSGATIDVISHSWGTVVAYEALRRLDDTSFPGKVQTLFTVGAALAIRPVRGRLQPGDGKRPRHVRRWVNLNARGDIVGGPLKGMQVDHDFLNLHPTACKKLVTPSCAHGSYFNVDNTAVNRDIFARYIQA